jgi:tetratricopeptide (TPR) repeat protein
MSVERTQSKETELNQVLSDLAIKEKRARKRAILYVLIPIIAGGAWVLFSYLQVVYLEKRKAELEKSVSELATEVKETERQKQDSEEVLQDFKEVASPDKTAPPPENSAPPNPTRAGIQAYRKGRYKEAVKFYDIALEQDPSNAYVWNLKGYSLFKDGQYQQSLEALRKALQIDPNYAWGYFDFARVSCAMAKSRSEKAYLEEASKAIRRAIELQPDLEKKMRKDSEFMGLCGELLNQILVR